MRRTSKEITKDGANERTSVRASQGTVQEQQASARAGERTSRRAHEQASARAHEQANKEAHKEENEKRDEQMSTNEHTNQRVNIKHDMRNIFAARRHNDKD